MPVRPSVCLIWAPSSNPTKLIKRATALAVPVRRLSWSLGLSPTISSQFTVEVCTAAENRKKTLKPHILRVQGHSRSSMSIPLKSSSPVLVMISSMPIPICICFHARHANIGKITTLQRGVPFWRSCAGLLEHMRLARGLLKSVINAENFMRKLSWST